MSARLIYALLLFFMLPPVAHAHRLNEYLQSTTISLGEDSIRLHLHLVAGSDIADKVLLEIDLNGNGLISETEQQDYAHIVLQGLSLNIDGKQSLLHLVDYSFPSTEEIRKGVGDIQIYLLAALISAQVNHHLILENHQQPAISVYLVNCLLPDSTDIRVTGQSRNYDQSLYTLDFTTSNAIHASNATQQSIDKTDNRAITKTYFIHGIRHILTGYDHLLFLCALILGATGLWNLIKIVTAFTIAHSITLTLATFGLAHLPQSIVEPFIAASIVCLAVQNIFWSRYAGGNGRLAIAFFFGLFHGLGFAGGLLEVMHSIPRHMVVYAILGFSLGVEAGNQIVLVPLYGILQGVKRFQRKTSKQERLLTLQRVASGVVAVAGLYYLCIALATHL